MAWLKVMEINANFKVNVSYKEFCKTKKKKKQSRQLEIHLIFN